MKYIKNIKLLLLAGLLLQVSIGFNSGRAEQGQTMLRNIPRSANSDNDWKPTGPTREDIEAATKVENRAVKGSREDKLISAVKNDDSKNLEILIAQDVDLEARDDENKTALMIATKRGNTDIASKLINAGANISAKDGFLTPLSYAFDNGHAEIVKLLIVHGAAKNDEDFKGRLVSAAFKGNNEMMKALMVEGDSIDPKDLRDAYDLARIKCSVEVVNAIKELLNKTRS